MYAYEVLNSKRRKLKKEKQLKIISKKLSRNTYFFCKNKIIISLIIRYKTLKRFYIEPLTTIQEDERHAIHCF